MAKIFEYPHYDQRTVDGDLVLFKLKTPVKFTDEIKPICLPSTLRQPADTRCYITGWGDTKGRLITYMYIRCSHMTFTSHLTVSTVVS